MSTNDEPRPRIEIRELAPQAYAAMRRFDRTIEFDPKIRELVKVRASILNGCAYCIDMHTKDARAAGETEQRLYALGAWEETPFFSERERAALALCDAVTLLPETHVPDDVWARASEHFDDEELAQLVLAIAAINSWNRIATSSRMVPGSYEVGALAEEAAA